MLFYGSYNEIGFEQQSRFSYVGIAFLIYA